MTKKTKGIIVLDTLFKCPCCNVVTGTIITRTDKGLRRDCTNCDKITYLVTTGWIQ